MTSIESRTAVANAALQLGIQGVLDVLIEHAAQQLEDAVNDKLARARAASDHRALVNLRDKVHS
jgi:hypothetical protein